jgi:hypothetical protein
MTKDELEILITDKPTDVKARAAVLYNAVLVTMNDYNKDRSVANLRNMDASKDAFDKFIAEIGGGKSGENFTSVSSVVKYLDESGWKIADKTLYRHIDKDHKLSRESDGTFSRKNVDKYASAYLKIKATGKRDEQKSDELQRQKLEQELKNLKQKNEREAFNFDKDRGLYIPKKQMEIELAARAGILDVGLKHWIQSNAAEWTRMVEGDTKHVGELINAMIRDLDEQINSYATPIEFEVVIDAEEESVKSEACHSREGGNPGMRNRGK